MRLIRAASAKYLIALWAIILLQVFSHNVSALDEIRYVKRFTMSAATHAYNLEALKLALDRTQDKFGPYNISFSDTEFSVRRVFKEMASAQGRINVHGTLSSREREKSAIPIAIPLRKGILSYRLVLMHRDHFSKFKDISTTEQLMTMNAGLVHDWVIRQVFKEIGAHVTDAFSTRNAFDMLNVGRFDYLSRGVNEVFKDLQMLPHNTNIVVHPDIALYCPIVYYFFVSKHHPKLARRIREGLELAVEDGSLNELFFRYYGDSILLSKLDERKIIAIKNPLLPNSAPWESRRYWYTPKGVADTKL